MMYSRPFPAVTFRELYLVFDGVSRMGNGLTVNASLIPQRRLWHGRLNLYDEAATSISQKISQNILLLLYHSPASFVMIATLLLGLFAYILYRIENPFRRRQLTDRNWVVSSGTNEKSLTVMFCAISYSTTIVLRVPIPLKLVVVLANRN